MWKKSEVWKNRKFQILLILELCLLCIGIAGVLKGNASVYDQEAMNVAINGGVYQKDTGHYSVDGNSGIYGEWLVAKGFELSPGSYELVVQYEAIDNGTNAISIQAANAPFNSLLSNTVTLYSGVESCRFQFYAMDWIDETDGLRIAVDYYGAQPLTVSGIEIIKTNAASIAFTVTVIAMSLLLNFVIMIYIYMGRYPVLMENKLVWFGIPLLAVLSSLPVFVDYIISGADLIFHILRIEFLADALVEGIFPVRIEADWIFGHGYANSLFYCDTFLLLPALMRMLGFPIGIAYAVFIIVVNLATAAIAYISFKGMFQDKYIGLLGSTLYTLAPYRVYNIYNRSAVGEFTAMTFLPLVCYGFYLLLGEDTKKKEYKHYWIVLMLGVSGIIQSHVLSCEIVAGFAGLMCLFMIKRVFCKDTFIQLVKAVVGTVLLNLWYLLPVLDMMISGKYKYSQNQGMHIQQRGILPANILDTMQSAGGNSRFHELGLIDTEPINVGVALMLGVIAFFLLRKSNKEQKSNVDRVGLLAFGIGMVAIIISTCYFPWDTIQTWNRITGTLIPMIQFPTRLTLIPTVCFTVVTCAAGVWMLKRSARLEKILFFGVVVGCSIFFSMYQTNDILNTKTGFIRLHTVEGAGHSGVLGAEYLPLEADLCYEYHDAWSSENVTVTEYLKENLDTQTTVKVSGNSEKNWIELPMIYYKGYRAEDAETKVVLPVEMGTGGHVRVLLEAEYEGTIHTWYNGMWYWHVAELISLLFALSVLIMYGGSYIKERRYMNKSM